MAIVTFLVGAFLLASAYLIASSEPNVWERLNQPYAGYPMKQLLPVHKVAVFRQDPSIILYLGQNAQWYGDDPLISLIPDWPSEKFFNRVAEKPPAQKWIKMRLYCRENGKVNPL